MLYRPHTFDMPWNQETLGDIVECALAQAWHFPNDPYWRDIQAALEDMVRVFLRHGTMYELKVAKRPMVAA